MSVIHRLDKYMWATAWQNQQNDLCTQRRLRSAWASAQSDQSSLSAWGKFSSLATHEEHIEDSDQTEQMPRLILVFTGHTCHFVGFVMMRLMYIVFNACEQHVILTVSVPQIKGQRWLIQMSKYVWTNITCICYFLCCVDTSVEWLPVVHIRTEV